VNRRLPEKPEVQVLDEPLAARVLARASELESVLGAGVPVTHLRAAAAEAGISTRAFDAALAEVQTAERAHAPGASEPRSRRRLAWPITAMFAFLIAVATVAVGRTVAPAPIPAPGSMVEEAFLLRCLSPSQAGELIRPVLRERTKATIYAPGNAPGILRIRSTPEDLQRARSVIDKYEGPGAPACTVPR
jgi:hypothetical protein